MAVCGTALRRTPRGLWPRCSGRGDGSPSGCSVLCHSRSLRAGEDRLGALRRRRSPLPHEPGSPCERGAGSRDRELADVRGRTGFEAQRGLRTAPALPRDAWTRGCARSAPPQPRAGVSTDGDRSAHHGTEPHGHLAPQRRRLAGLQARDVRSCSPIACGAATCASASGTCLVGNNTGTGVARFPVDLLVCSAT